MPKIRPTINFSSARGAWRADRTYDVSDETAQEWIAAGLVERVLTPVEHACEQLEAAGCGVVIVKKTPQSGMLLDVARARGLKVVTLRSVHTMNSRAKH